MRFWDHLIQVASLGTAKQQLDTAEADGDLQMALQTVTANSVLDAEETFLQATALSFNYRQSGAMLQAMPEAGIAIAPQEEKQYCSAQALKLLNEIIDTESTALLELWLNECATREQIVTPAFIPTLFDIAAANKKLQSTIGGSCGKRGEWLVIFNPGWRFAASEDLEELWQTGLPEQRKQALLQIRKAEPEKARILLAETWDKEDAASKTTLLAVLEENISEADLSFIESIQTEKSKKVKEVINDLLRRIPASAVVQLYANVLAQSIRIGKEKSMLGLLSKKVLQVQLPSLDDSFYATGIDKLSNVKGLSDELYILQQFIAAVPPVTVCTILQTNNTETAELLAAQAPQLLAAFIEAAIRFKDLACLREVVSVNTTEFYAAAIPLLSPAEANSYVSRYFESVGGTQMARERNEAIEVMCDANIPFSEAFSKLIANHIAEGLYQYNRKFFNKNIHLLHPSFVNAAEACQPKEAYYQSQWNNTVEYVKHLMQLRSAISTTFNHTTN